jgi:hypothetical protein
MERSFQSRFCHLLPRMAQWWHASNPDTEITPSGIRDAVRHTWSGHRYCKIPPDLIIFSVHSTKAMKHVYKITNTVKPLDSTSMIVIWKYNYDIKTSCLLQVLRIFSTVRHLFISLEQFSSFFYNICWYGIVISMINDCWLGKKFSAGRFKIVEETCQKWNTLLIWNTAVLGKQNVSAVKWTATQTHGSSEVKIQ